MKNVFVYLFFGAMVVVCFSCTKDKKTTPYVPISGGVSIAGTQSPMGSVGETLTFSSGSIVGVSSFTASVTAVTNGVSTYSGSAIVTNAAILNILSNIPEMTIHGDTVSSVNMKFRSTVNGIELCSGPTPGILAKYDSNVGDTYPIGTTGKVRTVTAKTGLDDYYWGGMYIKVMQVEETPNYSKSTAVTKITYISNHKFGLVGIKVNFDDGTSTTFPFQNTAQNSE